MRRNMKANIAPSLRAALLLPSKITRVCFPVRNRQLKVTVERLIAEGTTGPVCNYVKGVEPCPLEFLVHFVGDVHQPLHVNKPKLYLADSNPPLIFV